MTPIRVSSRPRADRGPQQAPQLRLLGWFSPHGGTCCPPRWQDVLAAASRPARPAGPSTPRPPTRKRCGWKERGRCGRDDTSMAGVAKYRASNSTRPEAPSSSPYSLIRPALSCRWAGSFVRVVERGHQRPSLWSIHPRPTACPNALTTFAA